MSAVCCYSLEKVSDDATGIAMNVVKSATAQRMENVRIVDGAYKSKFIFCKIKTPETVKHILLDCRKNVRAERAVQKSSAFFNLVEVSWQDPGGGVKT
ncbi:hypothetical protein AYI69_g3557 [Smittium culicis]|uniref:Uncharacterized protein n=1 Tax=Smittium culicis TaxID=133412 RepID=A0A1R1YJD2_9FUNG|nr:hypothetical protein AYI69_g3557 [Smittium culicis]